MSKNTPSLLLSDIQANVTTLATVIEITRQDNRVYRLTNHDEPLMVGEKFYRNDIPFILSSIQAGSSLAVDNTDLTLSCDGETIKAADFRAGAFDKAVISIGLVDYTAPEHGMLTLRRGWFGQIVPGRKNITQITVYGLLKILDFEVGRIYQPSCDADLGDRRCKVAIDLSQSFGNDNIFRQGDWFYAYDTSLMTEIALINGGFNDDGARGLAQDITGWTKSDGANLIVSASERLLPAYEGGFSLYGGLDTNPPPFLAYVTQDVDLVAAGMPAIDLDDGLFTFVLSVEIGQDTYLLDKPRVKIEILDADDNVIDLIDTDYFQLDSAPAWRRRFFAMPLITGARKARIYLMMLKTDDNITNTSFDDVHAYYYAHTVGNPYNDVIHNVKRVVPPQPAELLQRPYNASFAAQTVANSNTALISGWTRASGADYWTITNTPPGLPVPDGVNVLQGGDDASGVQKTYTLTQTVPLFAAPVLNVPKARVDIGAYVVKVYAAVGYIDSVSAAKISLEFRKQDNTVLSTSTILDFSPNLSAPAVGAVLGTATVPALAASVKIILQARSGVGVSAANVTFDDIRLYFVDALKPTRDDPLAGSADDTTAINYVDASYTWTGSLVLKAHSAHITYDVVDTVLSQKEFTGTDITGGDGAYETAVIRWISGDNAGQKNLVRVWNSATKGVKLYFSCTNPIQVGDRFQYTRACQKRFTQDCRGVFDNAVNFRGFPYLPGKLT